MRSCSTLRPKENISLFINVIKRAERSMYKPRAVVSAIDTHSTGTAVVSHVQLPVILRFRSKVKLATFNGIPRWRVIGAPSTLLSERWRAIFMVHPGS